MTPNRRGSRAVDIIIGDITTAATFQLVLLMFSGWINRHQLDVIEYLQEENRVLKERLGGRRIRFFRRSQTARATRRNARCRTSGPYLLLEVQGYGRRAYRQSVSWTSTP
jgi:hypothetical protein